MYLAMKLKQWSVAIVLGLLVSLSCRSASAGTIELSGSFSFNQSNYGPSNYEWTRSWSGSIGYYFFILSEIEISFEDVLNRSNLALSGDTTFHDQIYSIDWVQSLAPKDFFFQPYVKIGIGQLNRDASGTYPTGQSPPLIYDSVTAVAGAGVRFFLGHFFALHVEGTSYLTDGNISTWSDNFSFKAGFSLYL
jgi:hypothetical protein